MTADRGAGLDRLAAMTESEATAYLGGTPGCVTETIHVVIFDGLSISGREFIPNHTPDPNGVLVDRTYRAGDILPAGLRPDLLSHLENIGIVIAVHVPIDTKE